MATKTIPWPSVPGVGPAYSADDWKQMQRTFGGRARPRQQRRI